jgi:hypothetical protein
MILTCPRLATVPARVYIVADRVVLVHVAISYPSYAPHALDSATKCGVPRKNEEGLSDAQMDSANDTNPAAVSFCGSESAGRCGPLPIAKHSEHRRHLLATQWMDSGSDSSRQRSCGSCNSNPHLVVPSSCTLPCGWRQVGKKGNVLINPSRRVSTTKRATLLHPLPGVGGRKAHGCQHQRQGF